MVSLRYLIVFVFFYTVECVLLKLTCAQKRQIVDGHNLLRYKLACGQVPGQPAAAEMKMMVWDDEVATKAENWAYYEINMHNPDHTIPSQRFTTGENIFWSGYTIDIPIDLEKYMNGWGSECNNFKYHQLSNYDFSSPYPVGHYTQMAWSESVYIGCGASKYYRDGYFNYFFCCNYGPAGNTLGQYPYKSGYASNRLICGTQNCSQLYGNYC